MAKFYGEIGYGNSVEKPLGSGVWVDEVIERFYYGDVIRNSRRLQEAGVLNQDVVISNSISIVADDDGYANENFHAMKYVRWAGTRWEITEVDVQSPRLILRLGGVYNGPEVSSSDSA